MSRHSKELQQSVSTRSQTAHFEPNQYGRRPSSTVKRLAHVRTRGVEGANREESVKRFLGVVLSETELPLEVQMKVKFYFRLSLSNWDYFFIIVQSSVQCEGSQN